MKLNKTISALLSIFIVAISFSNASAQTVKGYLSIKGTVKIERQNFAVSKVKVFVDGVQEKIYDADANGKFSFNIDLNKRVVLEIVRQGYYSKKLEFNTNVPVEDVGIWNYKFSIELLPEVDGFDASVLNQPIGKIKFVEKVGDFDYDEAYTAEMQKRIKGMMKEYEQKRTAMYQKVLAQADEQFSQANYEEAVELYDKAIDIDPYDTYPDDQIIAIKKILAKNQNNEKNYQKNISIADNSFNSQQYANAQIYYKRALTYKDDQYPKSQLLKIDKILSDETAANAALAAKEKAYKDAIAAGDRGLNARQYETALAKYTEASGIKPNEQYPKDKIAEINSIIAKQQSDAANKAEIEKAYKEAIAQGDQQYNQKNLIEARTQYVKANELKPNEQYPKTRINTIDQLLAADKANGEKYNGFIAVADKSFAQKEYASAKTNYQQALSIKPDETYPKQKIAEIDNLLAQEKTQKANEGYAKFIALADAAFNKQDYTVAKDNYTQAAGFKPEETYPAQKIAEIDKIMAERAANQSKYNAAIAKADKLFKESKWADAQASYKEALAIFPTEQYPQSRINEIENKLLAMKNAEEQQKARDKAYADAVRQGDSLLNLKKYVDSKNAFNQALAVKAKEAYPKQKIAEIDKLLEQQKALDGKYINLISYADEQFSTEKYAEAKNNYNSALQLKPDESYPKERIAEIDKRLAEMKVAAEKKAKDDSQYNSLISQADAKFNAQSYTEAKTLYSQASAIKTNEAYPKQQIVAIDNLLAKQADTESKYKQAITTADGYFNQKKYTESITAYNQALSFKPNEAYPKQKIAEAQGIINAENQKKQQYSNLITQADNQFGQKDYTNAKTTYQQASQLMPNEQYPKTKIQQIDGLLADAAKQKAEQENQLRNYKAKVAEADRTFTAHDYDKAIELYNAAKAIKPDETYPDQQIAQINANIKAEQQKLDADYNAAITKGNELIASKQYDQAKAQFNQAKTIKPNETLPNQKLQEIENLIMKEKAEQEALAKIEADYKNAITRADVAFKTKDYSGAIGLYKSALAIKQDEKYPKSQIELCEKNIRDAKALAEAEAERQRKEQLANAQKSFDKKDFEVPTGQRSDKFLNDLAKQYPEGITTENYDSQNKKVKRVIVNKNGIAHEFVEAKYSYGTYYFRDGRSISSQVFYKETK